MRDDTSYKFPRGWFLVAFSEELAAGQVLALRYFDEELILFRTQAGVATVLEAFCPHLGAHLGHGGCVEGESIRCPFHAWRFDTSGACVEVPYATKIPPGARLAKRVTREHSGMILLWRDPAGEEPDYEVPAIEELSEAGWSSWSHSRITPRTHPREIVENVADRAHFAVVHRTHILSFAAEFVGHKAIQRQSSHGERDWGEGIKPISSVATYHGPAVQLTRLSGACEVILINAHTPIDETCLDLRFAVSVRTGPLDPARVHAIAGAYIDAIRNGFFEDVAIWEHKVFREQPLLCAGDGSLMELRHWYRQFYRPRSPAREGARSQL